jgi:LmbE family N-acetylglucosaminyl deacetylase
MQKTLLAFLFSFLFIFPAYAQKPHKPTASEIYESIRKLNFLGSVLYVAAHPDDENTRLISHLSNEVKARTAYISITRGDGGQNLIGSELGALLGIIRTHELEEARKTDGGEQFFTRAVDFGFSKQPDETFSIWGKDEILSDVVLAIRKFQPDIIINRFNHRTPGTTHGHHTASAILALDAFDRSADKTAFPEHLKHYNTWQPKRLFFNTSWWFYGSEEAFEKADKSNLVQLKTGAYYPSLGLSNGEIAALSRSKHQSQGFGNTGTRGEETEYLELLKGDMPTDPANLFEGINTTWTRIEGGKAIGDILHQVEKDFDFTNPGKSIPELVKAYKLLKNRTDYWGVQKTKEIETIIAACAGLFLEAVAETQYTSPGSEIKLRLEAINRSEVEMQLTDVIYNKKSLLNEQKALPENRRVNLESQIIIPRNAPYTSPYWIKKKGNTGLFNVDDIKKIGEPVINENEPVYFKVNIADESFTFKRDIIYKFNSPVTGEVYQPFQVLPEVTGKISEKVFIFGDDAPRNVAVKVRAGRDNVSGMVSLNHPPGWKVSEPQTFQLDNKDQEKEFVFTVTPPKQQSEGSLNLLMQVGDSYYVNETVTIDYDHIPYQHILLPAEAKIARIPLAINGENIGYISGAGDEVPSALRQIGYNVTEINLETMNLQSIIGFDAIVMGIRAYNVHDILRFRQDILFDYVKNGGNLIMQYNVSFSLITENLTPFKLNLSRVRITDHTAKMHFINPNHRVLNSPNKITQTDFDNWVQERGLYFANGWSKEFEPVFRISDPGEEPVEGALVIAQHGKGNIAYTGLSFFRQLPAGVPGAYRLFANLLSLSNE